MTLTDPDDDGSADAQIAPLSGSSFAPSLVAGDSGWGLATQGASQLLDANAVHLHVSKVRIVVPWDVVQRPHTADACGAKGDVGSNYANLKQWITNARQNGQEMLVSFGRCAQSAEYGRLPTTSQYKRAIERFLAEFPTSACTRRGTSPTVTGSPRAMSSARPPE